MVKRWLPLCLLLLSWMPGALAQLHSAPTLQATIDRARAEMGDIITLTLTLEDMPLSMPAPVAPDFQTLLDQHFHLIGQRHDRQLATRRGETLRRERWTLFLTPKRPGTLSIPAFEIADRRSEPLVVTVRALSNALKNHPLFHLEARIVPAGPLYLRQQGLYILRFLYRGELIRGHGDPPVIPDAQVVRLNNQASYRKVVDGQPYTVYEWRYAFFPGKSGVLEIAPVRFQGQLYARGKLHGIDLKTRPFRLEILPPPSDWPADQSWLPVRSLKARVQWKGDRDRRLKLGQSLSLQVTLEADSISANLLPDLPPPEDMPGVKVYADPAQSSQRRTLEGLIGQRTFRWTFIPTRPGKLALPDRLLAWWDTRHRRIDWVKIPGRTVTVTPAVATKSETSVSSRKTADSTPREADSTERLPLIGALIALTLSNLLWIGLWQRQRLRHRRNGLESRTTPADATDRRPPCQRSPSAFYAWLIRQPRHPWRQDAAFAALERALFARPADEAAARQAQRRLCDRPQKKQNKDVKKSHKKLKSLYP